MSQDRVRSLVRPGAALIAAERIADHLFWEIAPVALFFFVTFGLLFLIFKLFAAEYAIEFSAFSKAAVGGLILGKIVPLLERAQAGYRFRGYRRIVVVAGKTAIYAVAVILAWLAERLFATVRQDRSLAAGLQQIIVNANFDRFLGTTLLVSLVLGLYLTTREVDRALGGDGALFRLLCRRPSDSEQ